MATAPEQTFTDVHLCIYPESLDKAMKERLEEHYNLAYSIPNEKIGRDCYFPDGPSRCIVCPIRLSSLGIARKALHAMEQDGTIVAPLFAFAVMGARHGVPVPMRARPLPSPNDVKVEGKDLKAGTYALFLDVEKAGPWVWIFSKHLGWGSFQYDPKDDALRVPVTPQDGPFTEFLTYGFDERLPHSAVAYLRWEKKRIPFKIEVPNVNELYVAKIRQELQSWPGFNYQDWQTAAQFCADNKVNLEEALTWAEKAINAPFRGATIGHEDFSTLSTKAAVLEAMGREADADAVMEKALHVPGTDAYSIYAYGMGLLRKDKKSKAMEIFTFNRQQHSDEKFWTSLGLARGYTTLEDKKNAIANWEVVLQNIPANFEQPKRRVRGRLEEAERIQLRVNLA